MTTAQCANCGAALSGPYCPQCGQRASHSDPTIREFLHETGEELFHWEGKIPRTAKALLFRPGQLTRDFLEGRRARWLPPLRVYLLCSLVFFVSGPLSEHLAHRPLMNASFKISEDGQAAILTPELRERIANSLPARIFGAERLIRAVQSHKNFGAEIGANLPKAMFVLVPVFAALTWLLWHRRFRRYPSHLYAALHVHAAWFLIAAVITIITLPLPDAVASALGAAMAIYLVGYTLVVLRRVFEDAWTATIVKSIALLAMYVACLLTVTMGLLFYALSKT